LPRFFTSNPPKATAIDEMGSWFFVLNPEYIQIFELDARRRVPKQLRLAYEVDVLMIAVWELKNHTLL